MFAEAGNYSPDSAHAGDATPLYGGGGMLQDSGMDVGHPMPAYGGDATLREPDAGVDARVDAGSDASPGVDATADAGTDASDAGVKPEDAGQGMASYGVFANPDGAMP